MFVADALPAPPSVATTQLASTTRPDVLRRRIATILPPLVNAAGTIDAPADRG
jgi:hypothetical protein